MRTLVQPFTAAQFTATKFDSAEEKAKRANQLAVFIQAGMPASRFTKNGVYHTLYQHMFGHIAHYNESGFFSEWFSTPAQRAEWIRYALNCGWYGHPVGNPAFTWVDVETAIIEWLTDTDMLTRFEREANEAVETRERAQLAALQEKYR